MQDREEFTRDYERRIESWRKRADETPAHDAALEGLKARIAAAQAEIDRLTAADATGWPKARADFQEAWARIAEEFGESYEDATDGR